MPSAPALSDRLRAIACGLPKNGVICDVGSDHGALPLFLLKEGLCRRAIVTDLNEAPLQRAVLALTEAGVAERAKFVLTDGISEVLSEKPDAFVIAGMGGDTIAGILSRALDGISHGTRFALQPMTKEDRLRAFLFEHGFCIEDEVAVQENGKVFLILFARFGATALSRDTYDELALLVGNHLVHKKDEASRAYLLKVTEKIKTRWKGLQNDSEKHAEEIFCLEGVLSRLEEFHERS